MAGSAADEESSSGGVFSGRYRVNINCMGGYVVSAVSSGSDLLASPEITVQPGQPPIEINMRPGGGLHVKLTNPPAPRTGVLLVPAFSGSTGPVPGLAGEEYLAEDAEIHFVGLAPGDYLAYALADLQSLEYRSPEFLHGLTGGTSVHIEEGKENEITLTSLSSVTQ